MGEGSKVMTLHYTDERVTLHLGNCVEIMASLDEHSVDAIVTDPPYELGFMGKTWDSSGVAFNVETWRQALRVLKPGGHLIAFSGSRTYHRMAVAIEDAGFEIRDQIMWLYGSGFPKSHNLKDDWQGWGTALKPAHEPMVLARKPLIGTVAANVLAHGTGGLNIDATRVPGEVPSETQPSLRPNGDDSGHALGSGEGRNGEMSSAPGGRWPANVIHDGSDEVVAGFPQSKGGAYPAKRGQAVNTAFAGGQETEGGFRAMGDDGSASRFFYCAKTSKRDRNEGLEDFEERQTAGGGARHPDDYDDSERDQRLIAAAKAYGAHKAPAKNHHPTVKPTALMEYLIKLVTPTGGTVLDPFMGSGSTGKAAIYTGFNFIGIDMTPEYVDIAKARIAYAQRDTETIEETVFPKDFARPEITDETAPLTLDLDGAL